MSSSIAGLSKNECHCVICVHVPILPCFFMSPCKIKIIGGLYMRIYASYYVPLLYLWHKQEQFYFIITQDRNPHQQAESFASCS